MDAKNTRTLLDRERERIWVSRSESLSTVFSLFTTVKQRRRNGLLGNFS